MIPREKDEWKGERICTRLEKVVRIVKWVGIFDIFNFVIVLLLIIYFLKCYGIIHSETYVDNISYTITQER